MAQLLHKPEGNVNGKPRVYFACHPEDHRACFDEITNEICKIINCAVFYYDPEEEVAQDEDYYLDLSRMQLIVMPVTTRLLYVPNRAMDVEFAYAMENHIPVLPLMQERGLEDQYKQKFGDLQFLDKHDADPTAIPYTEKLKKYLESVLIGDELAKKIRAAFEAYVFLSYRKKDRKYAQELMRLLHRDETCRDIAIWYDEFLTPGEDFNDSIRKALKKSDLFLLTVTPNLVNESNYIMAHEYPMAKESGKPILPAEMVATDPDALRANYANIPPSIDPADAPVFADAVLNALGMLAHRENDDDPKHNFFIGLAYLGGIDVEVDHARALRLITSAAEAGLTEAMEKLVSMYETGEGVQRNYHTAILWREKLVAQAKQLWEETGDEENGYAYVSLLWDLGDAWYALRNISKANATYKKMRFLAEKLFAKFGGRKGLRFRSISNDNLGSIEESEGNLSGAKEWYLKGLEDRIILAKSGTLEALRDLSVSYERLGDVAEMANDLLDAKEWYQRGLEIRERLAQGGTIKAMRDLSIQYERLGNIAKAESDLPGAKKWYLMGVNVRAVLAKNGTPEFLVDLSVLCNKLGDIAKAENNLPGAKEWYTQALEIREMIAENGLLESLWRLSFCYNNLGSIAEAENDLESAKDWYEKCLKIREKLAKSNSQEFERGLAVSYGNLGNVAKAKGDLISAKKWYMRCLEIHKRLAKSGTAVSLRNLSVTYEKLGDIAKEEKSLDDAKVWYHKCLEKRERLVESGTPEALRDLSVIYDRLGNVAKAENDLSTAKRWYYKVLEIDEKLVKFGTPDFSRLLSITYDNLGNIAKTEGCRTEAKKCYMKSLEIRERLISTAPTVQGYEDLGISYYKLGTLLWDVGMLCRALDVFNFLAEKCPQIPRFAQYADIVKRLIRNI